MAFTGPTTTRSVTANGKYIMVYRKEQDGPWMAIDDINNRDAPVSSMRGSFCSWCFWRAPH